MSSNTLKSVGKENKPEKTPLQESNEEYTRDEEQMLPDKAIKRKISDDLDSVTTTGSYMDQPKRAKKWNAKNFKMTKQGKVELDEKTEEGKYQKRLEEMAKRREICTEICFKTFSDAEIFKENMQVNS